MEQFKLKEYMCIAKEGQGVCVYGGGEKGGSMKPYFTCIYQELS